MIESPLQQREDTAVFRDILTELEVLKSLLGEKGERIVSYGPKAAERLRARSLPQKQEILKIVRDYNELIAPIIEENTAVLNNEIDILKGVLRDLRLIVDDGIWEKIEKDDIIEIYNRDVIQIYRSISHMNLCGYTLLDVLTHEFYELYERSLPINEQMMEATLKVLSGEQPGGFGLTGMIPKHLMREIFSASRGVFEIEFKYICPVYKWPKNLDGFIVVQRARNYSGPADDKIHFL